MFISMWVIYLVVVLALVVAPVFTVFSIRRNTNALIKKLDDKFEKMSSELKLYAGRSTLEPKSINNSTADIEKRTMGLLGGIRNITTCIAFFTVTSSAVMFFSSRKNRLRQCLSKQFCLFYGDLFDGNSKLHFHCKLFMYNN